MLYTVTYCDLLLFSLLYFAVLHRGHGQSGAAQRRAGQGRGAARRGSRELRPYVRDFKETVFHLFTNHVDTIP